jgi:hypothetical protein
MSNNRRLREPAWKRAPCGCAFRVRREVFIIRPCSPSCPVWQYTRQQAALQGKEFAVMMTAELN